MNIWITADTHYWHSKIIKYTNRPFKHIEDMNIELIENYNQLVKPNDIVYHLGDFALCGKNFRMRILEQLNGKIHLIRGSHDNSIKNDEGFVEICDYKQIKFNRYKFVLFHWPIANWQNRYYGSIHLYGHSHGKYQMGGRCLDVGVDNNNFQPWHIEEIIEMMRNIDYKVNTPRRKHRGIYPETGRDCIPNLKMFREAL